MRNLIELTEDEDNGEEGGKGSKGFDETRIPTAFVVSCLIPHPSKYFK